MVGAAAVSSRLHTSGTASSRAKTADKSAGNSVSNGSSGNTSPQEKTANMLKNTLRKMTRFSIGNNGKKKDAAEDNFVKPAIPEPDSKHRSRSTFLGKSRVPKSQSPAPSSNIARSKSFKETGAGGSNNVPSRPGSGTVTSGGQFSGYNGNTGLTRNNVYTSSLRRTKMKHQAKEETDEKSSSARPTSK